MVRALILAGGFGTRLKEITALVPKPMVDIAGKPFLDYLLKDLANQGLKNVTLLVGHKKEVIIDSYKNSFESLSIDYVAEDSPLGTGGAILNAMKHYPNDDEFLVINGDTYFGINYTEFISKKKGQATLALSHQLDVSRYGSVVIDPDFRVKNFIEKNETSSAGYINGGIVFLNRSLFAGVTAEKFSFEKDILELEARNGQIFGIPCDGEFIDIGTPSSYEEAQIFFPKWFGE